MSIFCSDVFDLLLAVDEYEELALMKAHQASETYSYLYIIKLDNRQGSIIIARALIEIGSATKLTSNEGIALGCVAVELSAQLGGLAAGLGPGADTSPSNAHEAASDFLCQ